MMTDKELKEAIVRYVKEHYERNREAPSLGKIVKRFKGEKLSLSRLYRVFPKGVSEVCKLAGVPVPTERMKRTEKATKATKSKQQAATVEIPLVTGLPFSQVYHIDEDGNKMSLDEWSDFVRDGVFDLENDVLDIREKLAMMMRKVNGVCPKCGGKLALDVTCRNCEESFMAPDL